MGDISRTNDRKEIEQFFNIKTYIASNSNEFQNSTLKSTEVIRNLWGFLILQFRAKFHLNVHNANYCKPIILKFKTIIYNGINKLG